MLTLEDRITRRLRASDYTGWRAKVEATGGCLHPVHLTGRYELQDLTGAALTGRSGHIFAPCGNRRASVCPACSDRYAADAFHLVRAGLAGGTKGVPGSVAERPRFFVTLTAPSFGPVHNRRVSRRGRVQPCACGGYHHDADPRIGTPLDPAGYDYTAAVLWQAHAGELWHRFTIALRRQLAHAAGLSERAFRESARLSYAKVAEYQRRGLIHFHAAIRIDGPTGPDTPAPAWVTADLLEHAIRAAARTVTLTAARPDGAPVELVWGEQVDIRRIRPDQAHQVEDKRGEISDQRLAGYVAKYATKGTGKTEAADRPIRSQRDIDHLAVADHHRRMIQTCWDLGALPQYQRLNLRKWAHMLGFRGHFLTKSKHYSTTFKAIREERRTYRLRQTLDELETQGVDLDTVVVVNHWQFTGIGYADQAERELAEAIGERKRQQRQRKYEQEEAA
ncbi:replication initiator [Gandjariella thermophila]|uniref:replication initiator n=1 Tax=Gandjariella thermophila TaxID=1931992 RepID=UPI0010F69DC6|nr:replication initiator [Gandjariella thermophila]